MPNRFTAIPERPVPPVGPLMAPVVSVADLFMGLMLSRPGGLSLRNAWVTPATLWLSALFTPAAAVLAILLAGGVGCLRPPALLRWRSSPSEARPWPPWGPLSAAGIGAGGPDNVAK